MVDWKNIGVPIIVAIIAGTVALVSALINFIIAALFTPNIQISASFKPRGNMTNSVTAAANLKGNTTTISITNNGTAAAKNLKLTAQAPPNTVFTDRPFSTEKYNATIDPTRLEIYVPRFVQGIGSLINIVSQNYTGNTGKYVVYITFDQGSVKREIPPFGNPTTGTQASFNQYQIALISLIVGGASISFAVWSHRKKTAVRIIEVNPVDGSMGVEIESPVTATFSAPICSSSINPNTFSVKDYNGNPAQGMLTLTDNKTTIRFNPVLPLNRNSRYIVTVTKEIMDMSGTSIAANMVWSFITVA